MAKRKTFAQIREETAKQTESAVIARVVRFLHQLDYGEAADRVSRGASSNFQVRDADDYFGVRK
jgi:hypothetical protein